MRSNTVNINNIKCLAADCPRIRDLAYNYVDDFIRPMGSHTKNVDIKHCGLHILNISMRSYSSNMQMPHNSNYMHKYATVNRV